MSSEASNASMLAGQELPEPPQEVEPRVEPVRQQAARVEPVGASDLQKPLVLMMIGRGGGGHKASARAVEAALQSQQEELDIEFIDTGYLIESASTGRKMREDGFDFDELYNALMRRGFFRLAGALGYLSGLLLTFRGGAIRRGLATYWRRRQPTLVISFVPFFNACFRDSLLRSCPDAKLITCITDFASSSAHCWIEPWVGPQSRAHHLVAGGALLQQQAAARGYPSEHVIATPGMVVHPAFHETDVEAAAGDGGRGGEARRTGGTMALIFFGGAAPMRVLRIVRSLRAAHPSVSIVVVCGRNKALQQRLTAQGACEVEGFIPPEAVRAHMAAASFILGKPGPGVVSEAAAAGTPFVTERRYAMPQERPVLEWIGEAQTGVVVDSLTKLPNDLLGRVEACRAAIDAHMAARPAVWIVADAVRSLLEAGPDRTAVP